MKTAFIDPLRTNTAEKTLEWQEVLTAEIYFTHGESSNLVPESGFAGLGRTCLEMRHKRVITWKSTHDTTNNRKHGSAEDPT